MGEDELSTTVAVVEIDGKLDGIRSLPLRVFFNIYFVYIDQLTVPHTLVQDSMTVDGHFDVEQEPSFKVAVVESHGNLYFIHL